MYTIVFGLRNVTDTLAALKDARRVLKPGGKFICMEFSSVSNESLRNFYEAYSFGVIPLMGELIAQDERSYQYLVESIKMFPRQVELEEIMREAGFKCVAHENLTGEWSLYTAGFEFEKKKLERLNATVVNLTIGTHAGELRRVHQTLSMSLATLPSSPASYDFSASRLDGSP